MTTAKEVFERALRLLGYTDSLGEIDGAQDAEMYKRGMTAVQQIYADCAGIEHPGGADFLQDMNAPLNLSAKTVNDVMPYGVAMLIAQNDGNGDSQALFATLYNQKRMAVPRPASRIRDAFPRGGY